MYTFLKYDLIDIFSRGLCALTAPKADEAADLLILTAPKAHKF